MQRVPPLAPFEESPFRRALVERLAELPHDGVMTYAEASAIIHGDAQKDGYHIVKSARDALLKQGIVVAAVPNIGLKRLSHVGAVSATEGHLDRSHNAVNRAGRILHTCDFDALPEPDKKRHGLAQLRVSILRQFSGRHATRRLKGAVEQATTPTDLRKQLRGVLDQFGVKVDPSP